MGQESSRVCVLHRRYSVLIAMTLRRFGRFPTVAPVCRASFVSFTITVPQPCHWREEPALASLASLYVHVMLRRLVPSLATEMHLAVRLLHVHPNGARDLNAKSAIPGRHGQPSSGCDLKLCSPAREMRHERSTDAVREAKIVFKTGLDCRAFAARVFLGLTSLLPHMGTDTLDLLSSSLALVSEVSATAKEFIERRA